MKITLAIGSNILQQKNIDEAQSRLRHLLPGIVFGEAVWTTPIGIQSDRFLNLLPMPTPRFRSSICKRNSRPSSARWATVMRTTSRVT